LNSAYLWIFFPCLVSAILLLFQKREVLVAVLGTLIAALLAGLAAFLPVQEQLTFGSWVINFSDTFDIYGRRFILSAADRPSLIVIYLTAALWFGAAPIARSGRLFVPLGLAMVALLTAAIAVEPFLFAAVIIVIAVLVSIPFLSPPGNTPGRGVLRYLSFQTIGIPFILFSGLMLVGFEVGPGNQELVVVALATLVIGFAILLAVFPFHTWIPMLAQEAHPYAAAFVFLLLPGAVSLLGFGFLNRFVWLKEAPNTAILLLSVGAFMIVTAGIWSAVERHLGRLMGFALILDIGFSFIAIGLASKNESGAYQGLFFSGMVSRGFSLGVWALALSGLRRYVESLDFKSVSGLGRKYPITMISISLSIFCLAGVPLLASFPIRMGLLEGLAVTAPQIVWWSMFGSAGLLLGGFRTLAVLVAGADENGWRITEPRLLVVYLLIGGLGLILLGLFPHLLNQILVNFPGLFQQ
jgi:NADH-quinone oxidoreductase subunit N